MSSIKCISYEKAEEIECLLRYTNMTIHAISKATNVSRTVILRILNGTRIGVKSHEEIDRNPDVFFKSQVRCPIHGLVVGEYCVTCRTRRAIELEGKPPLPPEDHRIPLGDPTPDEIIKRRDAIRAKRVRGVHISHKRYSKNLTRRPSRTWQNHERIVRIYPDNFTEIYRP